MRRHRCPSLWLAVWQNVSGGNAEHRKCEPHLLRLLLFCFEPKRPCRTMIGDSSYSGSWGGRYRVNARLRCRRGSCWRRAKVLARGREVRSSRVNHTLVRQFMSAQREVESQNGSVEENGSGRVPPFAMTEVPRLGRQVKKRRVGNDVYGTF